MQQIAAATGVTRATVSLALRGDPCIPPVTRERIAECARELGYRPNPMITALMSNLRNGKSQSGATTLAYLSPFTLEQTRMKPTAQRYLKGAQDRAGELGYNFEFFCFGKKGLSENRLAAILHTRAIRGVLVSPGDDQRDDYSLDLPWKELCAATLGYTLRKPMLSRAVNHQFHSIGIALKTATRYGYQRLALLIHRSDDLRTESLWQAGYLLHQHNIPARQRIPPAFLDELNTTAKLKKWLAQHRPDAVLILHREVGNLLREAGACIPEEIGLILLDRSPIHTGMAGVDQRPELVGQAGINLVARRLMHNEFGLPAIQNSILTEGEWVDDDSLPALDSRLTNSTPTIPS